MNFFFENLSLLPETSAAMEYFKLVFGSGNSDLAKIRPLKIWTLDWLTVYAGGSFDVFWLASYGRLHAPLLEAKSHKAEPKGKSRRSKF